MFGLKGMDCGLCAEGIPGLRHRLIHFPYSCFFAASVEEQGLGGALACLQCSWLVTCSPCVLAALLTAQMELLEIAASGTHCGFVNDKNT